MKKKYSKLFAAVFLIMSLIISGFTQYDMISASNIEDGDVIPSIKLIGGINNISVNAGDTITIKLPVTALKTKITEPGISIKDIDTLPLDVVSDFGLSIEGQSDAVKNINEYVTTYVTFQLHISDSAKMGTYKISLLFDTQSKMGEYLSEPIELTNAIRLKVVSEKAGPNISLEKTEYPDSLKKGKTFNLGLTLKNTGDVDAKSVKVSLEGFATDGIITNGTVSSKNIKQIIVSGSSSIVFPLKISNDAQKGVKSLDVVFKYKDLEGKEFENKSTVYFNITEGTVISTEGTPNVVISDVVQSPVSPNAGGKVKLSYILENKSSMDMKDIKISVSNLGSANFSPIESEPYKYIESLKAGGKKKINMEFDISKDIAEGMNELELQCSYKDANGTAGSDTAKLYVLDVKNPKEVNDSSTPKLIISDFTTGSDEVLKAGDTFDFSYEILNTHSSKTAKNIKVTVTSENNIFSQTKGSNSFYIASIQPGEKIGKVMELKVKSDSTTQAYPLQIKFEYEYDGKIQSDQTMIDGAISAEPVTEIINLSVMENSRPVVSNIIVGTWEPPIVQTPTTLAFDFCNMGKAVLSNVTARIESTDFTQTGDMLFIGNVEAGSLVNKEIEVTPNMEGTCSGTLIISYEDSNGNTVEVPTEFTADVMPMENFDPIIDNMDPMEDIPQAKKAILNTWLFVAIQVVLFIITMVIARKIVISMYKKKMQEKEENDF